MDDPRVTIVVTPREQFSQAERSLQSIIDHTDEPYQLVYVDGRSPRRVRRSIEALAERSGFRTVRSRRYLTPNRARNLGLAHVDSEYVVFVDNDLIVSPEWLTRLVETADATGAWAVGPLYFEGPPEDRIIHMAGGDYTLGAENGHRTFATVHRHQGTHVDALDEPLRRQQVDFAEFHCMLVRTEALHRLGPLDEQLLSTREHLDFCIDVAQAGGEVWFEPNSLVTYKAPPPLRATDLPYFWLRWNDRWYRRSLERFVAKHGLDPSYCDRVGIAANRRRIIFRRPKRWVRSMVGDRAWGWLASLRRR